MVCVKPWLVPEVNSLDISTSKLLDYCGHLHSDNTDLY